MTGDPLLRALRVADQVETVNALKRAAPSGGRAAIDLAALDRAIVAGWHSGFDTLGIAKGAKQPEAVVANRLAQLRDSGALA